MSFSHPLLVIAHFEFPDLLDLNDYLVRPLTFQVYQEGFPQCSHICFSQYASHLRHGVHEETPNTQDKKIFTFFSMQL